MINVPRNYAGFRSAFSVLDDPALTHAQKRKALLSWRSAMQQAVATSKEGRMRRSAVLTEIDEALAILDEET
ncbi:hypothetical protein [Stappia stellulata]|uniref:hypothetical protein n=1 Tax=Stappia stellulata TaxID=71235 RepID=UPI0004278710|nr:hypothetical protein [Stappia stellulata]